MLFIKKRSESNKALSEKVYSPVHEQLARALTTIEQREAFGEGSPWKLMAYSGLSGKLKRSTRKQLRSVYETLADYDRAWSAARERYQEILVRWDDQYGSGLLAGRTARFERVHLRFDWWNFLAAEECVPLPNPLQPNQVIPIRERYINAGTLKSISLRQFLQERWAEATDVSSIATYGTVRAKATKEIKRVMRHLEQKIQV